MIKTGLNKFYKHFLNISKMQDTDHYFKINLTKNK